MPFIATDFEGLFVFEPRVFTDARGYFYEAYNEKTFQAAGIENFFVQDNQSSSTFGVIRGLHYQRPPFAQAKLVRVLRGVILDVAVDIRSGSPTFGRSFSLELSEENKKQLFIPAGFAHGFSVLSEMAEVLYKCDQFYDKGSDAGISFDDAELQIDWRVPAQAQVISEKDRVLQSLADYREAMIF